ncbi:MAG: peptidoglycan synthetase [Bacteroidetes bacterium GWA2_40_14]|nr:MAG: peptidoglycan synthetase [Bacteroidetes bacterium GWA2_40_14]HAZ03659.1 peptidoglycan synthetase [Marinilabiliales bacterium]
MNYHFIAIGGSAMHNLAIALHKKGDQVSGSDDEIFEPSRSRLEKHGLLPKQLGWFPDKIGNSLDAIVLGMHAKADNPELLKAKQMGITIYSYPEFLYNQTQNKTRVVVGGSHGKTTTTAMIMHVLQENHRKFDYMVGAQLEGFETMVNFSDDADIAVFEGDEYLTSPIDLRPKFHLYKPHIGLITGIAWDHINVFPTFKNYVSQFALFADQIEHGGTLIYFGQDTELQKIAAHKKQDIETIAYQTHPYRVKDGNTLLETLQGEVALQIFGEHNLQNISGAYHVCKKLGITDNEFYRAISSFKGASKRLQLLAQSKNLTVFLDFAHSPSKLKATIDAVKNQFPDKKLVACMELHTYSSLNKDFLEQYKSSMEKADAAMVFYSHHAIELKRLEPIDSKMITEAFEKKGLVVFDDAEIFKKELFFMEFQNSILLWLSSGNFEGLNLTEMAKQLVEKNS